jgi:hypothetical protein
MLGNTLPCSVRLRVRIEQSGDRPFLDDRPFLIELHNLTVEAAKIA